MLRHFGSTIENGGCFIYFDQIVSFYTQALVLFWQPTTPRFRQIHDLLLRITPCIAENIFLVSTTFEIRMICDIKICFLTFEQFKNARNTSRCISPGQYSVKQEMHICLLQVNSLFVTTSSYPNRKTLTYRKENCLVNYALSKDNYLILIKQGGVLHHNEAIDQEMRQL